MSLEQLDIYVGEVKDRSDRWENITRELEQHQLLKQAILVEAVTPHDPEIYRLSGGLNIDIPRSHGATYRMELACLATHLKILRMIVAKGRPGIVMEGDAVLHKNFRGIINEILKQITPAHELIYLGCQGSAVYHGPPSIVKREGIVWGTVGYWVSPIRAQKMLQVYGRPMESYQVYTSEMISHPQLGPAHQVLPMPIVEDPCGFSSIRENQFAKINYDYFARFGFDNYGSESRRTNPPFIVLLHKYLTSDNVSEQQQILEKLRPYLAQSTFLEIALKRGLKLVN
jgi:GR25 family glycosyltransferase involved in LPS biosynthesis